MGAGPMAFETFAAAWNPPLLAGTALAGAGFLAAIGPMRHRFSGSAPVPAARAMAFLGALGALYAAVGSPFDELADRLFSAHMVQHLLLVLAAAPLLLLGTPAWLLPRRLRAVASARGLRWLRRPAAGLVVFNAVFAAFHLPALYEAALEHPPLHDLEHLLLLATAVLAWRPVCVPGAADRLAPLGRLRYVLANAAAMAALCAALAFAGHPLYPTYARTGAWGALTPLEDQRLGAIVMMLAAMAANGLAALAAFLQMAEEGGGLQGRADVHGGACAAAGADAGSLARAGGA
jgi:putative membrane protein